MAERIDLITSQDIEAYIDGAVSGERLRAVERKLISDERAMGAALRTLRVSTDLKLMAEALYRDASLRAEVVRLLAERKSRRRTAAV